MKKQYSKDFKIKACELVVKDGLKAKVVADKFGVRDTTLYRWIKDYTTNGDDAFVGSGHLHSADAKLRKLQKENEDLRIENEILKKAAAYFAKHPSEE